MEKLMTQLKFMSAALIATAMLATPAMAREHGVSSRHVTESANPQATPGARYVDGQLCYPAPRVGAFATQPWDNAPPCEPAMGPTY
jgi:hypothetical protein